MSNSAEFVVAGGGIVGLSLALALKRALGQGANVVVADPALAREADDGRAFAFAAASRRLLEALEVWPQLAAQAQPILDMVITDSRLRDAVRPKLLSFAGELAPGEPYAHMIEHPVVRNALTAACRASGVTLRPSAVARAEDSGARILADFADGGRIAAHLVIAADGARSHLRARAGIAVQTHAYDQSGIVATLACEHDHGGRAEEHFLPAGPFAFLPLTGRRASLVWTEQSDAAVRYCRAAPEVALDDIRIRLGNHLGALTLLEPPRAFPLQRLLARRFWKGRLALIGDAAHVVHPVAGQGLNLGFRDVAALAESIVDAVRLGLDPGGADVLLRYERWRRFDTMAMMAATDGLVRLFSNDLAPLRLVRDVGLGMVERMSGLKRFFLREAAGFGGEVPRLSRGERL